MLMVTAQHCCMASEGSDKSRLQVTKVEAFHQKPSASSHRLQYNVKDQTLTVTLLLIHINRTNIRQTRACHEDPHLPIFTYLPLISPHHVRPRAQLP
jgi:hypothetical protein